MSCLPGSGGNGSAQKKQKMSGPQSSSGVAAQHQSSPHRHNLDHNSAMQHHHLNLISNSAATNSHSSSPTSYHPVGHPHLGRNRVGSAADVDLNSHITPYTSNSVYVNGYAQHGSSSNLGNHMSSGGLLGGHSSRSNGNIPNGYGGVHSVGSSPQGGSSGISSPAHIISPQHSRVPNSCSSVGGASNQSPMGSLPEFPPGNSVSSYDMCVYCFDVLINKLKPGEIPSVAQPTFAHANESFPLFVTWKRQESENSKPVLRGCIGTFTDTKLHKGLHDYALSSALKDSRFSPITDEEIPKLVVSVSVLLHFESADSWDDWEIGVHGVRLEIETDRGQKKTATYLPEVASEQRWSKKQTIDSLLQKSGYSGRINSEVRNRIRLTRYRSEKVTMPYSEYRNRRAAMRGLQHSHGGHNHHRSLMNKGAAAVDSSDVRHLANGGIPNQGHGHTHSNSPMKSTLVLPPNGNVMGGSSSSGSSVAANSYRRSGASPRRNLNNSLSDSHPL